MKAHLFGLVAVHECTCTPAMVARYQGRVSGSLPDRSDIHVEVPQVECKRLPGGRSGGTQPPLPAGCRVDLVHEG